jgi:hypothetical protein
MLVKLSTLKPPVAGRHKEQASLGGKVFYLNLIQIPYTVFHQRANSCYVHSAISALAFRLTTVIVKMCGGMHFRHSAVTQQSGNSCLNLNIWQRVI